MQKKCVKIVMDLSRPQRGCGFDLNEPPLLSTTDVEPEPVSDYVVRAHLQRVPPLTEPPARIPSTAPCSACGGQGSEKIFVCDFCERVFHILCMGSRDVGGFEELICADCYKNGGTSKLWPIGPSRKKRIILDINAPPPREGDGEAELPGLRKHTPGCSEILSSRAREGFQDQGFRTAVSVGPQNLGLMYLQALKEFISARHGVLDDGWNVELKPSISYGEMYPVYCAPDGKKFESMQEVASYLGLIFSSNMGEPKVPIEVSPTAQEKLQGTRRRKPSRNLNGGGFSRTREGSGSVFSEGPSSDTQGIELPSISRSNLGYGDVFVEGPDASGSSEAYDYLPLRFEDFYILSLGKVDARPTYHDASHIWPVGYRSCWHDKITGSVFLCEVLDGGDSGPVFRVTRSSCFVVPPPSASTVYRPNLSLFLGTEGRFGRTSYRIDCDHDESIQMMFSDPVPPLENDVISCLGGYVAASDVQTYRKAQPTGTAHLFENPPRDNWSLSSAIGEISVEDSSLSSAWSLIAQKFIKSWSEMSKQEGACIFYCKHAENREDAQDWEIINSKSNGAFKALSKFGSSLDALGIPTISKGEDEIQKISISLAKRLENDRFGLDTAFVQEILEHVTGIQACYKYEHLGRRSSSSTLLTVTNGLLAVITKDRVQTEQDNPLGILFRKLKRANQAEDCVTVNSCPPGKPLCSRIPYKLIGDVYQVWELFQRFYEVLCLEEPVSLDELQGELINPCSGGFSILSTIKKEIAGIRNLESRTVDSIGGQTMSSSNESGPFVSEENSSSFIVGTRANEAVQAKDSTGSDCRVFGLVLTKAHNALLKVLVSELLSKVAVHVDPSFDSGESKSRRGRKKDVECLNSARRAKLNMLPLNELTWPELARRYILSFLSMDGNLESPEITTRESGKVFCCLQGDGGVLCGALAGVAGMEADALILADAKKQIFSSSKRENDLITIEREEISEAGGASENRNANSSDIPEWAQVLEPVRKLPTNVGTRIRNCVHSALEKNPPEWAKKILEHSISKGVYKGNASGPTKRAVLSVLAEVSGQEQLQRNDKGRKKKTVTVSISDLIMKQCRIVLRRTATADDAKVFCNLLGRKLICLSGNDDEGLLGSPAIVSRPLDFRTIDLRLAAGSYGRSHEAFLDDVRELWNNVRVAYCDRPDLIDLAESLSQSFESLYEKEVVTLVQKLAGFSNSELSVETKKEINDLLSNTTQIPKAPWEEGVCKVCGIDRDDDSVLLCDACDAEYHTYCLNPPLPRIPEGHWYCPSCIIRRCAALNSSGLTQPIGRQKKKQYQGELTCRYLEKLAQLSSGIAQREYWDLSPDERAFLLKFLCDELLNSALVRQHLEHCFEKTAELQCKLRSLSAELKSLKSESYYSKMDCERSCNSSKAMELPLSQSLPQEMGQLGKDICLQSDLQDSLARSKVDLAILDQELASQSKETFSAKKEIAVVNNSIRDISSQLVKFSIRREFLGSDATGRLYWAFATPSGYSSITVDGSELHLKGGKIGNIPATLAQWVTHDTDAEIEDLLCWLKDNDPKEKELKESVMQWQKLRFQDCQQSQNQGHQGKFQSNLSKLGSPEKSDYFGSLLTKAASLLEKNYGLCLKSEIPDILKLREKAEGANDEKLYRCGCLELIWPSTIHCFFCHRTFLSQSEVEGHNDKCRSQSVGEEKGKRKEKGKSTSHLVKGKGKAKYNFQEKNSDEPNKADGCPFKFDEICSKFVTRNSNKELVKEIGLIGSGGIPSLLPEPSPYLGESVLLIKQQDVGNAVDEANTVERSDIPQESNCLTSGVPISIRSDSCPRRFVADEFEASRVSRPTLGSDIRKKKALSGQFSDEARDSLVSIPSTSTMPLVGKAAQILTWLKICLLDMDAALSDEALSSSKADPKKRLAWRSFVKSAATIYEVIQATIILEDMIKYEYLKNDWWHWSSLSAATKTATLSSLALRIYALDAAITYKKSDAENVPSSSMMDMKSQPGSDSVEKSRVTRKSSKKRKETG